MNYRCPYSHRMLICLCALTLLPRAAQADEDKKMVTSAEAKAMCATVNPQRTSVHDPSVVYDNDGHYYIFGSHVAVAKTADLTNWTWTGLTWGKPNASGGVTIVSSDEAFKENQTKEVTIGGVTRTFGNYDAAEWNCALPGTDADGNVFDWTVDGNMWAPNVVFNPTMNKWCQYLSMNGPVWNSCIILLTSDKIEGPYVYQGPVVYTGFRNDTDERISYHKTDLELVLGELSALPDRYKQTNWGAYWPHAIDPCAFYDEEGRLWLMYGSWSGGIYALELDEQTGLRDYDVVYGSDYDTKKASVTTDAYFGKKIAGGYYVSGEGPYIEHIGKYYYLFMSYGGFDPDGGYEMRVFRSSAPDGPYTDAQGNSAIFTSYRMNYGANADTRGEKVLGAYDKWGFMTVGECAQGHNSVIAAPDGRTYLVYHTKFNDGTYGHQVRVHQVFMNNADWPVVAPFEYSGETLTDADVASAPVYTAAELVGTYELLVHKYGIDYEHYELVTPVQITLNANGTVSGAYTGRWYPHDGNAYFQILLGSTMYNGVAIPQHLEPTSLQAVCFTACSEQGENVWGYRLDDRSKVASAVNALPKLVYDGLYISRSIDLYNLELPQGVVARWTSSHPDIFSHTGRYNPAGLTEDTPIQVALTLECGDYAWSETYQVTVKKEAEVSGDWLTGIKAYYGFDASPYVNAYQVQQEAVLKREGSNRRPLIETDSVRTGGVLHQYFGASGNCSYTEMDNALYGSAIDGFTIGMWVKRTDDVPWDAIWSFYNPTAGARLYFTGNTYMGFNNGTDWLDINHPSSVVSDNMPVGSWCYLTLTVSRTDGVVLYVNGARKRDLVYNGLSGGTSVSTASGFDYNKVIDFVQQCPKFYLGYGSFWGSADVRVDDVILYNRVLPLADVRALYTMNSRVTDFTIGEGGTPVQEVLRECPVPAGAVYDLAGRRHHSASRGVYVVGGKKLLLRE